MSFPPPTPGSAFGIPQALPASPAAPRFPFTAAIVGAVALLGAAMASVSIVRSTQPVPSASAAAPVSPAPGPTFDVRMQVTPANAYVVVDGTPMGTGALARAFPRNGQHHTLYAFAAGYESATIEFDEANLPPPVLTLHQASTDPALAASQSASTRRPGAPAGVIAPPLGATTPGARPGGRVGTRTDNIDPWKQ
jgi:hypothetical protein